MIKLMNTTIISQILSALLITLLPSVPSNAIEYGQNAEGDSNAVHIQGNVTGFLYSERIIFTAAHVLDQLNIKENGDTDGFVFAPGIADKTNAKQYKIVKAYIPKTYISSSYNTQKIDDFAVIVINEDMPLKTLVQVATEQKMNEFADKKSIVQYIGYGLQNNDQRNSNNLKNVFPYKAIGSLLTPKMMVDHYNIYANQRPVIWEKIEYGVLGNESSGSPCNGDSGSGIFIEENSIRYYLGALATGLSMSNCGLLTIKPDNGGTMIWLSPAYKFMDIIEKAESFVKEEKQKEFSKIEEEQQITKESQIAKQEAKQEEGRKASSELSEKKTITCFKGKVKKKITSNNSKCPYGYKKSRH